MQNAVAGLSVEQVRGSVCAGSRLDGCPGEHVGRRGIAGSRARARCVQRNIDSSPSTYAPSHSTWRGYTDAIFPSPFPPRFRNHVRGRGEREEGASASLIHVLYCGYFEKCLVSRRFASAGILILISTGHSPNLQRDYVKLTERRSIRERTTKFHYFSRESLCVKSLFLS